MPRQKITDEPPPRPGPKTIHPAFAWPVIFTCALYVMAQCYQYGLADQFQPWWLGLTGLPVVVAGSTAAKWGWDYVTYGPDMAGEGRVLAVVSGIATSVWMVWAGFHNPTGRGLAPLGIGAILLGGWFAALWLHAERERIRRLPTIGDVPAHDHPGMWREIFDKAGCKAMLITDTEAHRAGLRMTVIPDPDADKQPTTYNEFASKASKIGTVAAMLYRRAGSPLPSSNAIRIAPGPDDATFILNVTERDVFADSHTYLGDAGPADIYQPADIGQYEDGTRILLSLLSGHMKIVGMTGAGKSVLLNNVIARINACHNAVVWVCATDKLMPLVWPWLAPWFEGKVSKPPIDYVAGNDANAVRHLLIDAYRLCCERNARLGRTTKMTATTKEPAVFVVIEEFSHAVAFKDKIQTHDGQWCNIGDLVKMLLQAGRSANVKLILVSQYGINIGLGDRAAEMNRNLTVRICLRTTSGHDGTSTLAGLPASVDTTKIPLYTMYVQPSIDEPRIEPGKAAELDGSRTVETVAVRQAAWAPAGIEPNLAALLYSYDHRWMSENHPDLARLVEDEGLPWRIPTGDGGSAPEPQPEPAPEPPATPTPTPTEPPTKPPAKEPTMTSAWTEEDEAELRRLLGTDGPAPPADPFQLPDQTGLNRLKNLSAQLGTPPPNRGGPVQPPRKVPEPLGSILAALEEIDEPAEWYTTEDLAGLIGWPIDDVPRLGARLTEVMKSPARNLPRSLDPARRKGRRVVELREAAVRYRLGP